MPFEEHLAAAVDLARQGRFRVEPNPLVGAVVLDAGGEVVGRGYHARYGGPHAEVVALDAAGERAHGGTLVVTLEPCAHDRPKKTPRCAPRVARSGVRRVVVGAADPDASTRGRARRTIEAAGIAYEEVSGHEACADLLRRYRDIHARGVPWAIGKWAMSLDGRTADAQGGSRWISSEPSRALVHELRGAVEAVVVGVGTVIADDPSLTCRAPGGSSPLRVVLDTTLRTPTDARVVTTARETGTLLLTTAAAPAERRAALEAAGVEVEVIESAGGVDAGVDLHGAWRVLHARGVRRLLVEAGGRVMGACASAGLLRQIAAFTAPVLVGGATAPGPIHTEGWLIGKAPRLQEPRVTSIGTDALVEGYWPLADADWEDTTGVVVDADH